jgi:hypothetical protein
MKSVPEAILPRYSANNDRYPVLDSLYKTIKSNSLVKSGNQYKTIDFEDEKNASQPISEIMACIIFSAYLRKLLLIRLKKTRLMSI